MAGFKYSSSAYSFESQLKSLLLAWSQKHADAVTHQNNHTHNCLFANVTLIITAHQLDLFHLTFK